jgi:LEA14-like dessication related protein
VRKILAVIILVLGFMVSGCVSEPELKSIQLKWGNVDSVQSELLSEITLNNPNPFSIPLSDVRVNIFMNDIHMGEGNALGDTTISSGEDKLTIVSYIENRRLKDWWVTHIEDGEKTEIEVKGDLYFNVLGFELGIPTGYSMEIQTNILEQMAGSEFNVDLLGFDAIEMENTIFKWNVEEGDTEIVVSMDVKNNMPYSIPIGFINYRLKMNGIDFGSGKTEGMTIPAMGKKNVEVIIDIDDSKISEWWVTHIKNGEKTAASIDLQIGVEFAGEEKVIDITPQEFEFNTNIATAE